MTAQPSAVGGAETATQIAADEIARRVADLVVERISEPFRLVDTQTLARMLAVSEEWVRAHAAELGAVRVGDGPKGALRFDLARVRATLERRRLERPKDRQRRPQRHGPRSLGLVPAAVPADVKDW